MNRVNHGKPWVARDLRALRSMIRAQGYNLDCDVAGIVLGRSENSVRAKVTVIMTIDLISKNFDGDTTLRHIRPKRIRQCQKA